MKGRSRPGDSTAILARIPEHIPEQPAKLMGGSGALTTIDRLLAERSKVLLHGMGGIGKTALAASFATGWIQNSGGPVLWLRVGSQSAEQVYHALARPFGYQDRLATAVHESREREELAHLLAEAGATLLVFDDVWWNRRALTAVLDATPGNVPVLATSRQRFSGLGAIFDVTNLDPSSALDLLSYHAERDCRQDDAAARICAQLGGHPFSIERAGKLLSRRNWSASTLLERLNKSRPENLALPDVGSKERSSVQAMLDTTVAALDKKEEILLHNIGHFFAPALTTEVLQLHVGAAQDVAPSLDALQDWGLLQYIPEERHRVAQYRPHDLTFSYARGRASDEQLNRALDTLLSLSRAHRTPANSDVAAVIPLLQNFMGAVKYAMGNERYRDVEEIVWNLHTKQQLSQYHGFFAECIALLEEAVEAARHVGDAEHEGAYVGNIGKLCSLTGRVEEAYRYHEQALEIAIRAGDTAGIAIDLGNLGEVASALGRYAEAIEHGRRGLAIIRKTNDLRHECILLRYLGLTYSRAHDHEAADNCFTEALAISVRIGDQHQEHLLLGCLGDLAFDQSAFRDAAVHFTKALALAERLDHQTARAEGLVRLGCVHINLGENLEALRDFENAVAAMRDLQDQRGEADAFFNMGIAYVNLKRYDRATESYRQALQIAEEIGDVPLGLNVRDAMEHAEWQSRIELG